MPAPLVWAAIVAGAAGVGLVADAVWGDDEAQDALQGAGVNDPTQIDWSNPPQEVIEALDGLPDDVQQRVAGQIQQQVVQQQQRSADDTDLGGLAGTLGPTGAAGGAEEGAPPEGATFEGHVFSEPPPTVGGAPAEARDGDLAEAFMFGGLPTGPGQVDEQGRLLAGAEVPGEPSAPSGHTPSGAVVPYLQSLHEWATARAPDREQFYRQRFYRAESLRLTRELETRRTSQPASGSLDTAEQRLREFYDNEGSLTPWESDDPLEFDEGILTAPANDAARHINTIESARDAPIMLDEVDFAPFGSIADREDLTGSSVDTSGLLDALGNSGFDAAMLTSVEAAASMADPGAGAVYVRRKQGQLPSTYRPDTGSLAGIERTSQALEQARVFESSGEALIDQMHRMSETQVEEMQVALWKAGFFGQQVPTRGVPDSLTVQAFEAAIEEAARYRRAGEVVTLEDVLERRAEWWADKLGDLLTGGRGGPREVQVTLEDPAALTEVLEQQAQATIGRNLSPEETQQFIAAIHGAQRSEAQRKVQAEAAALAEWQPETPWDDPPEAVTGAGGVTETMAVSSVARAEDFAESAAPAEAGATDFANVYGSFLESLSGPFGGS